MQNSHEIREFVWLYDRIDIMESWTEELENKLIELLQQNECYKQRTDLLSTDWLRAAQRPSAIGVVRRRGCPKRRNSTQLNSTGRRRGVQSDSTHNSTPLDVELSWVEFSCVAINEALWAKHTNVRLFDFVPDSSEDCFSIFAWNYLAFSAAEFSLSENK